MVFVAIDSKPGNPIVVSGRIKLIVHLKRKGQIAAKSLHIDGNVCDEIVVMSSRSVVRLSWGDAQTFSDQREIEIVQQCAVV